MAKSKQLAETVRLEALWSGEFGDQYVDRNRDAGKIRKAFWRQTLRQLGNVETACEVGCNLGANLQWVATKLEPRNVYGIDINEKALAALRTNHPGVNAVWAPARALPFRDRWFDLVFTMGVLIHQPESTLPLVMSEIVRCSKKYVLCGEYYDKRTSEVHYRGHQGALFRRDYGSLYRSLFPELSLIRKGFLGRDRGWDDVTYWIFGK